MPARRSWCRCDPRASEASGQAKIQRGLMKVRSRSGALGLRQYRVLVAFHTGQYRRKPPLWSRGAARSCRPGREPRNESLSTPGGCGFARACIGILCCKCARGSRAAVSRARWVASFRGVTGATPCSGHTPPPSDPLTGTSPPFGSGRTDTREPFCGTAFRFRSRNR